jgi:plasmid replication initiation protein
LIASTAGVRITATTEDLRQEESDVFLMLVHLARMHPLGNQVEVTAHHLLKAMNWCTGSADYLRLRTCIKRLTEATIWVSFDGGRNGFSGRLVEKVEWADAGSGSRERWRIRLDPQILHLFGDTDFSLVDWQKRLQLRTLAKWLHNYFASHREPLPISVGRLYELCGSSNKRLSGFRADLVSALDELRRVGFLTYYGIGDKNDLVVVRRNQARGLPEPDMQLLEA